MTRYHKIQSVYKRDPATNHKTFLDGVWSLPEFGYLAKNPWCFTEKVDGTNIRVMWNSITKRVTIGGKSDAAQLPGRLNQKLTADIPRLVAAFDVDFAQTDVCLYGEGYGAGIQKGGGYGEGQNYVGFDVRIGDYWLDREGVEEVHESLGLETVPVRGYGSLYDAIESVRGGFSSRWGEFPAEGLVCRPTQELMTRHGDRVITKIKHKDFPR
jgi:hypothetical protein